MTMCTWETDVVHLHTSSALFIYYIVHVSWLYFHKCVSAIRILLIIWICKKDSSPPTVLNLLLMYGGSVMRSYCPEILVTLTQGTPQIWKLDLNFKSSYHIASLFYLIGPVWSLKAPQGPQVAKNVNLKNCLLIVSPGCTYVSTVMRSAFADILVPQGLLDIM